MTKRSSSSSLFETLQNLESDDVQAIKKRRALASSSIAKSKAARNQSSLYSTLISIRILLQRSLTDKNRDGSDDDVTATTRKNDTDELLSQLLIARRKLMRADDHDDNNSDLRNITSSDDVVGDNNGDENDDDDEREEKMQKEYESCREHWKSVLDKRHHDIRLHSGLTVKTARKFKVMELNFWDQVEGVVANERLLRRSNDVDVDDDDDDETTDEKGTTTTTSAISLFDDGKVYQHMLKDFISNGQKDDVVKAAKDRLMEREKKKKKKKKGGSGGREVDRKASKGRKIRYTVHPKLTNFCFPVSRSEPLIESDDLFRSLFGGVVGGQKKKDKDGGDGMLGMD